MKAPWPLATVQDVETAPRMHALVVYESMYGNTREVARAIAEGLREHMDVGVRAVHTVSADTMREMDLVVVGGPTPMHGMASSMSRKAAIQAAEEDGVELDESAREEPGLRKWLTGQEGDRTSAAAFDTRIEKAATLTGAASRGIAKRLRRRGFELIAEPESFFVEDSEGPLAEGEVERARDWGRELAASSVIAVTQ